MSTAEDGAVDIVAAVEYNDEVLVYYNGGLGASWTAATIASCGRCYFVKPCEFKFPRHHNDSLHPVPLLALCARCEPVVAPPTLACIWITPSRVGTANMGLVSWESLVSPFKFKSSLLLFV